MTTHKDGNSVMNSQEFAAQLSRNKMANSLWELLSLRERSNHTSPSHPKKLDLVTDAD
jgi:hypothetical protein